MNDPNSYSSARLRAVIFDVDGTLIDSNAAHAETWTKAFAHFGFERDAAAIRQQMGKGGDQLLPVFLSKEEIAQHGQAIEQWRTELFTKEYLPNLHAFPQVRELLQRVVGDERRVVLASSASEKELKSYVELARIGDLLEGATSRDDAKHSKPHPDIFAAALARLAGIAAPAALVIGDSPYDAEAASQLNLRTIGLLSGGFSEEQLRAAGCLAIYQSPADLLAHYDTSPLGRVE